MTEVLLMYVTKKIAYLKNIGMNIINHLTNKMRKTVLDCQTSFGRVFYLKISRKVKKFVS